MGVAHAEGREKQEMRTESLLLRTAPKRGPTNTAAPHALTGAQSQAPPRPHVLSQALRGSEAWPGAETASSHPHRSEQGTQPLALCLSRPSTQGEWRQHPYPKAAVREEREKVRGEEGGW